MQNNNNGRDRSPHGRSRQQGSGNRARTRPNGNRGSKGGAPKGGSGDARRSLDQQTYDGPAIPDDIQASDLDRRLRQSLSNLPPKLADRAARHLVAAGRLIDEDPAAALDHAKAARARATRNAVVREAVGEAAYSAGDYSQALSELRAARRMNGAQAYAAVIADCERALGRPERAARMDTAQLRDSLDRAERVELAIVVAGARREMGQIDAGLQRLERVNPQTTSREPWLARLRYAYADMLIAAGRERDGLEWFHRTVAVDGEQHTDAEERIAGLS